ncbi:hypothetical protein, partial [Methylomonas koyamae]|uniref:hypothetical protein n=1 Tax=Methylomonas koyamae TaxID=702114 RepID=UPI00210FD142
MKLRVDIEVVCCKLNISKRYQATNPFLLAARHGHYRANQVWALDTTYTDGPGYCVFNRSGR